jgi:hypothetical protein
MRPSKVRLPFEMFPMISGFVASLDLVPDGAVTSVRPLPTVFFSPFIQNTGSFAVPLLSY